MMRRSRFVFGILPAVCFVVGLAALGLPPASAEPPDFCPQPSGPPGLECRGCPTFEDPVVCTVLCAGGHTQKTFTNACFASCSGYRIVGECVRTGG